MTDRIGAYTFLPWLRQGIAAADRRRSTRSARRAHAPSGPTLDVSFDVNGQPLDPKTVSSWSAPATSSASTRARSCAPSRATGSPTSSRTTSPSSSSTTRTSRGATRRAAPAPGHRLRPWLVVLVLDRGRVRAGWPTRPGPLPSDPPRRSARPGRPLPARRQTWAVGPRARQPGHQRRPHTDTRPDRRTPSRTRARPTPTRLSRLSPRKARAARRITLRGPGLRDRPPGRAGLDPSGRRPGAVVGRSGSTPSSTAGTSARASGATSSTSSTCSRPRPVDDAGRRPRHGRPAAGFRRAGAEPIRR